MLAAFRTGNTPFDALAAMLDSLQVACKKLLLQARDQGTDIFDQQYQLIPNSNPPRYHTRYDGSIDQQLTQLLDYMLEQLPGGFLPFLLDKNANCPTHNTRYSRHHKGNLANATSTIRTTPILDAPATLGGAQNATGVQIGKT